MNSIRSNWIGRWIADSPALGCGVAERPAPIFRKKFNLDTLPCQAILYLAGLGYHELYVNRRRVGDAVLTPAPAQFDRHVPYNIYDVTDYLRAGANTVAIWLGNGWFNANTVVSWQFEHVPWRAQPKMICDLEFDGQVVVASGEDWQYHPSPIIANALRNGETYDARLEIPDFSDPDGSNDGWKPSTSTTPPGGLYFGEIQPPCRIVQHYTPVAEYYLTTWESVYDFGCNLSGVVEINVHGQAGTELIVTYSEKLHNQHGFADNGEFGHVFSGEFQTDHYFLKGDPAGETFRPRFTYHGFRYAQVRISDPAAAKIQGIRACFIHTDFKSTGSLELSDPTLSRLQNMTLQSFRSNFVGIPTDCPHREKNGWTGDAQLAMEAGCWNYDLETSARQFLQTVCDAQRPNGQLPGSVPTGGFGYQWGNGPGWDSMLFEYPYQLYCFYGNREAVEYAYPSMERYLNYCRTMSDRDGLYGFGLGDWCIHDDRRIAPTAFTNSAWLCGDCRKMADFARLLNRPGDAEAYENMADEISRKLVAKFLSDTALQQMETTMLGGALYYQLGDRHLRKRLLKQLVDRLKNTRFKADFGIMGAKWVPRALAEAGCIDLGWRLFTQPECPGWGYWVQSGATTLWEHWNGVSSQNHIMFGDVSAWLYRYLGGIRPCWERPGFEAVELVPAPIAGIEHFQAAYQSKYGRIVSGWTYRQGQCEIDIELPNGVEGRLRKRNGEVVVVSGHITMSGTEFIEGAEKK